MISNFNPKILKEMMKIFRSRFKAAGLDGRFKCRWHGDVGYLVHTFLMKDLTSEKWYGIENLTSIFKIELEFCNWDREVDEMIHRVLIDLGERK